MSRRADTVNAHRFRKDHVTVTCLSEVPRFPPEQSGKRPNRSSESATCRRGCLAQHFAHRARSGFSRRRLHPTRIITASPRRNILSASGTRACGHSSTLQYSNTLPLRKDLAPNCRALQAVASPNKKHPHTSTHTSAGYGPTARQPDNAALPVPGGDRGRNSTAISLMYIYAPWFDELTCNFM